MSVISPGGKKSGCLFIASSQINHGCITVLPAVAHIQVSANVSLQVVFGRVKSVFAAVMAVKRCQYPEVATSSSRTSSGSPSLGQLSPKTLFALLFAHPIFVRQPCQTIIITLQGGDHAHRSVLDVIATIARKDEAGLLHRFNCL